ncbi:MAG: hypothetical protein K6G12_00385 [Lachnospiraceae bacterium]|nr:hypothetical protein [Lachnospiraceae bacterium]
MSKNIVKFYNQTPQDETKIIDSNSLMEKKLQEVSVKAKKRPEKQEISGETLVAGENAEAGFVEGLDADQLEMLISDEGSEGEGSHVFKAVDPGAEAENIRMAAKAEADEIVATAEQLAREFKENSRREAEIECTRIRADAKQAGYQDGLVQAQDEYSARMQELDMREQALMQEFESIYAELEPKFISTITGIYERIFHVELGQYEPILSNLVATAMRGIEASKQYIVHVSREDYADLNDTHRALLEEAAPGCRVDVIEDVGLTRNQCMLETDNGIFDCGMDTQLSELRRKLMILSYDPTVSDPET